MTSSPFAALSVASSGRCGKSFGDGFVLFDFFGVKLRMEEIIQLFGFDLEQCFFFGAKTFFDEVNRYVDCRQSGTLAVTGLEHIEFAAFDRELHILHIFEVAFEFGGNFDKLRVNFGVGFFEVADGRRSTDPRNNVFALGVHQIFAVEVFVTVGGVTRKRNAGTRSFAHVAEYHRLNVNRGTPVAGDVVHAAIYDCAGVVPAAENGFDGADQLNLGILREVLALFLQIERFVTFDQFFQVVCGQFGVEFDALSFFDFVDDLFKEVFTDADNDVGVHLNESAIAVVSETGIVGQFGKAFDRHVVQTEVEDGVHHTGHRSSCAAADGNEEGVLAVAEFFAGFRLEFGEFGKDLVDHFLRNLFAVGIVFGAGLGRDGEPLGNRHPEFGHFGKVCAFTAKQRFVGAVGFFEQINVFCHRYSPLEFSQFESIVMFVGFNR